jgi:hypothetical protein
MICGSKGSLGGSKSVVGGNNGHAPFKYVSVGQMDVRFWRQQRSQWPHVLRKVHGEQFGLFR